MSPARGPHTAFLCAWQTRAVSGARRGARGLLLRGGTAAPPSHVPGRALAPHTHSSEQPALASLCLGCRGHQLASREVARVEPLLPRQLALVALRAGDPGGEVTRREARE